MTWKEAERHGSIVYTFDCWPGETLCASVTWKAKYQYTLYCPEDPSRLYLQHSFIRDHLSILRAVRQADAGLSMDAKELFYGQMLNTCRAGGPLYAYDYSVVQEFAESYFTEYLTVTLIGSDLLLSKFYDRTLSMRMYPLIQQERYSQF